MGLKYMRKYQLGRESVAGTPVAATTIWRGGGAIDDQTTRKFSEQNIGILANVDSSYISKYFASPIFDPTECTFEQLFHIFEAGIKAVGTGVADGAGSGKIYTYPMPTTATNSIKTYTIEGGDDVAAEEVEYGFVSEFNLSGSGDGAWMVDSVWGGRQVTTTTFTNSLSVPTTEIMQFLKTKLYIDAISGSYGITRVSSTLLEAKIKVVTGWIPVWTADGSLYFTFNKCVGPTINMDLTFEHNASAVAQKAAWKAGTRKKVALQCQGSNLTTAGVYSTKSFLILLPGSWEKFEKLDEKDGNDIISGKFRVGYNELAGEAGTFTIVNEISSVP